MFSITDSKQAPLQAQMLILQIQDSHSTMQVTPCRAPGLPPGMCVAEQVLGLRRSGFSQGLPRLPEHPAEGGHLCAALSGKPDGISKKVTDSSGRGGTGR